MAKILITGGNGYIGNALFRHLHSVGESVWIGNRGGCQDANSIKTPELSAEANWRNLLVGFDVVIHTAGRAHQSNKYSKDSEKLFFEINTAGTLRLAEDAALSGVKKFIFISSIGVNGLQTSRGHAFSASDIPKPSNIYALSKWEAEKGLWLIADRTGMQVVIIRPPLVYGPNAPGNFGVLMRAVQRGWPLPLGAVTQNRRSLVALGNLVDLIKTCVVHPKAANQTFLVSDGEDISTTEFLQKIGKALNRQTRLLPVPVSLLAFAFRLLGKKDMAQGLLGSLQVDIDKTCDLLNWKPPISVDEGFRRAVEQRV